VPIFLKSYKIFVYGILIFKKVPLKNIIKKAYKTYKIVSTDKQILISILFN